MSARFDTAEPRKFLENVEITVHIVEYENMKVYKRCEMSKSCVCALCEAESWLGPGLIQRPTTPVIGNLGEIITSG